MPYINGTDAAGAAVCSALDAWAKEEEIQEDVGADEGGWELDADGEDVEERELDDGEAPVEDEDLGVGATPGVRDGDLGSEFAIRC